VKALEWILVYLIYGDFGIYRTFGAFNGILVHFVASMGYFSRFGLLCQDKSGNPGLAESFSSRVRHVSPFVANAPPSQPRSFIEFDSY
jgi:hypothetical protein